MPHWVEACSTIDIEEEGVRRFDHGDATYAIYRSPEDAYYATAGLCTHQHVHLADGVVMEHVVECPSTAGSSTTRPVNQWARQSASASRHTR